MQTIKIRPKYQPDAKPFRHSISLFTLIILLYIWLFVIYSLFGLQNEIAFHFKINGESDGWGSKYNLLLMPLIATGLYFLFAFIQKKPEMYNYVVQITEENAQKQYSLAIGLMRWLNFCLQLTFVLISKMMVLSSHTGKNPVPLLLLAGLIVILTLAPVIVYVKASIKNK